MKKLLELITEEFEKAFEKCDYDKKLGKVSVSNRPDLCEYQCNGAMAGAKLFQAYLPNSFHLNILLKSRYSN